MDLTRAKLMAPVRVAILLFSVLTVYCFGVFVDNCWADSQTQSVVGFMIPKKDPSAREKSLVVGFELYFREKGLDPAKFLATQEYGTSEEEVLEALAELTKSKDVRIIVTPVRLEFAEQVVAGTASAESLVFVTNPAVRFVSGEMCRTNVFRVCPNTYVSSQPLARWAFQNIGRKIFIVNEGTEIASEQADFFALGSEKIGSSFGDRFVVMPDFTKYEKIFEKLEEVKPAFVFAAMSPNISASFVDAYCAKGLEKKYPLIGVESLTAYPDPVSKLKNSGLGIRTLCSLVDPVGLFKAASFGALTSPDLDMVAQGYDIAAVFYSCLNAGCFAESSIEKASQFASKLTLEGPRGNIQFDANHEAVLAMRVSHWEKGADGGLLRVVDEQLEPCRSIDFGCGLVGFPDRPEAASQDVNQGLWEEHQQ